MRKQIGSAGRGELLRAVADRYNQASRGERRTILDEFVAITGYHRKHAIRVLSAADSRLTRVRRTRLRLYDEAVRESVVVLWEASDRLCGKRLKPLIPVLLEALQRHGHLLLDEAVRARVLAISAATIDRLLAPTRLAVRGRQRASAKPAIRSKVPIRTFSDWNEPLPTGALPEPEPGMVAGGVQPGDAFEGFQAAEGSNGRQRVARNALLGEGRAAPGPFCDPLHHWCPEAGHGCAGAEGRGVSQR